MKILRTLFFSRRKLMQVVPLFKDDRVPASLKGLAVVLAVLIFTPLNILGDIPVIGLFDDAALLLFLTGWFVREATKHIERNITPQTVAADLRVR